MNYKFIDFSNALINIKHIICFDKMKGLNNYSGRYGIKITIRDYSPLYEWYDSEKERDDRYLELKRFLIE